MADIISKVVKPSKRPEWQCACGLDKNNPKAKHQWWCPEKKVK